MRMRSAWIHVYCHRSTVANSANNFFFICWTLLQIWKKTCMSWYEGENFVENHMIYTSVRKNNIRSITFKKHRSTKEIKENHKAQERASQQRISLVKLNVSCTLIRGKLCFGISLANHAYRIVYHWLWLILQ